VASGRDFGKPERVPALLLVAGDGDLARSAAEQLSAGDLLDQVGVDMPGFKQADAVLEPRAIGTHGHEFLLLHG
jgi:hypothetical protein